MGTLPSFTVPGSGVEARAVQEQMRAKLKVGDHFTNGEEIAGIDVGYDTARGLAHASVVRMKRSELKVIEQAEAFVPVDFPYIPGLLAFREIPAILAALSRLSRLPELLMVDGHGIAHPRRMGIASHLGVHLDWPTIGVAKKRLTGTYNEPGPNKGDWSPLMSGAEQIGCVLRSREKVKPLFVAPGHRVSMETALAITLQCLRGYRLPEPTRMADKLSKCKPQPQGELHAMA